MQFLPVLHQHVLRHGPKNTEADPDGRRGEPGKWSAVGMKQSSYRLTRDELRVRPADKSTGQHLWVMQKMPIHGTSDRNRMGSTPWTRQVEPTMNNGMTIGPSYSALVLAKWSVAKCSTSSWPWVNLSHFQCKDESDLLSRCFEYPARACHIAQESQRCMSVTAVLTNIGMMLNRLTVSQLFSMPAVQWGARMGSLISVMLVELGPDFWRKGRVQHRLFIRRFMI